MDSAQVLINSRNLAKKLSAGKPISPIYIIDKQTLSAALKQEDFKTLISHYHRVYRLLVDSIAKSVIESQSVDAKQMKIYTDFLNDSLISNPGIFSGQERWMSIQVTSQEFNAYYMKQFSKIEANVRGSSVSFSQEFKEVYSLYLIGVRLPPRADKLLESSFNTLVEIQADVVLDFLRA